MKAFVRDRKALAAVGPQKLATYLRAKGWRPVEVPAYSATLWRKRVSGSEHEIFTPDESGVADYSLRVSEVLSTLEETEQTDQITILNNILHVDLDNIRIRASADSDNTIKLREGADFIKHSHDLLFAAACSTVDPRAYFPTRKPAEAVEYMDTVRLGQTEGGSYTLNLLSPVIPQLNSDQENQLFPPEPFPRRVVVNLVNALSEADMAAQRAIATGEFSPFSKSIVSGVSANLCEAISNIGDINRDSGLDLRINWSPTRSVDENIPNTVHISSDSIPAIKEATRWFKEAAPRPEFELEGAVVRLQREEGEQSGEVTIIGLVDGRQKKVVLRLEDPNYDTAIHAHREGVPISCTGELIKDGRSFRLKNARDLRISGD